MGRELMEPQRSIITPEAVGLTTDLAGFGSRFIAGVIDTLIQSATMLALFFVTRATAPDSGGSVVFLIIASIVLFVAYYPVFEILWSGQTPGKRAQRIRVVRRDGQPVSIVASLIRNFVRLVDFLPAYYVVGIVSMLAHPQSRRLGDLAAGTVVVREPKLLAPQAVLLAPGAREAAASIDTSALTHREYAAVRSFLERRDKLDHNARIQVAAALAAPLRKRLGSGPQYDEPYLEAVAASFRMRFEARP